jgi:hypothetical protein
MTYLIEQVTARCAQKGLPLPDPRTIKARVDRIDRRTVALKRKDAKGVKATKAIPGEYAASQPLEVVQIDHTEVDVFLVNETTRKTMDKRPWLTLAIDVSRVGRRVSFVHGQAVPHFARPLHIEGGIRQERVVEVSIGAQDCLLASRCVGFGRHPAVRPLWRSRAASLSGVCGRGPDLAALAEFSRSSFGRRPGQSRRRWIAPDSKDRVFENCTAIPLSAAAVDAIR